MQAMKQAKKDKKDEQRHLVASLPFAIPHSPRYVFYRSEYPVGASRLLKKKQEAVQGRSLINIPHTGAVTYAAIVNPRYVAGSDAPRFAAIRFPKAVLPEVGAELKRLVLDCKSVSSLRTG